MISRSIVVCPTFGARGESGAKSNDQGHDEYATLYELSYFSNVHKYTRILCII